MEFKQYGLVFLISLGLTLVVLPLFIPFLHKLKYGQTVSRYMPNQVKKSGTPTMGGILFVLIPILVLYFFHPESFQDMKFVIVILAYVGYALIGFIDDFIIVVTKNNDGLLPRYKLLLQLFLAVIFYVLFQSQISTDVAIPFTNIVLPLGNFYSILVFFMFVGASNGVNLTDGMDGLAAGTSMLALSPFVLFAIRQGEYAIALFVVACIASLIGYLRFNFFPAKIFMGDTGALALGGLVAALGLVLKQELAVIIIGGVFVVETLSVILQILSVKIRGKRILKCSPIHYHFSESGMSEISVVLMFWFAGFLLAAAGFVIGVLY